jgi:phosphoribosylamine--glycine ligase
MGAISPVPFATEAFMQKVKERIIEPTILGLKKENIPYIGFIFIGLMKVKDDPFVIEYNVRMGDPETEVVIPRLQSDLLELLQAAANKNLENIKPVFKPLHAAAVMLVSAGYPGNYPKGLPIHIKEKFADSTIFHAGTCMKESQFHTCGGRVIAVSSLAPTLQNALDASYRQAESITFEGKYYRKDIGADLK